MPSLPRKTLPSRKGVKYAAYKDAKDRLRKARAIQRRKENYQAALFMADEIFRNGRTLPLNSRDDDEEDKFTVLNSSIYYEHCDLIARLQKVADARKK
jgi:hypothetical protein